MPLSAASSRVPRNVEIRMTNGQLGFNVVASRRLSGDSIGPISTLRPAVWVEAHTTSDGGYRCAKCGPIRCVIWLWGVFPKCN